jgi:hypothetical protein
MIMVKRASEECWVKNSGEKRAGKILAPSLEPLVHRETSGWSGVEFGFRTSRPSTRIVGEKNHV